MPNSTARRLITGRTPGIPWQTGYVWLLGTAPNVVAQPQNIFERVRSWAWTSRPMTVSIVAGAASPAFTVGGLPEVRCGSGRSYALACPRCGVAPVAHTPWPARGAVWLRSLIRRGLPEVRCGSVRSSQARPPLAPRRRLLIRIGGPQDARLVQGSADELEADREPRGAESARHRDRGKPRHVRRDREDVVQVHRERVCFLPVLEGHVRRHGRHDQVHATERGVEVAAYECPHLLGAPVIRLVVPGREDVGPEHDPALDLGAEARRTRAARHLDEVLRSGDAQTVLHTVVARQIRRGLRRSDHVVGRERVGRGRERDALDRGAEPTQN